MRCEGHHRGLVHHWLGGLPPVAFVVTFFLFLSSCATGPTQGRLVKALPDSYRTHQQEKKETDSPVLPETRPGDTGGRLYKESPPREKKVEDLPYAVHYESEIQPGEEIRPRTRTKPEQAPQKQQRVFTDKMFKTPPPVTESPPVTGPEPETQTPNGGFPFFTDDMSRRTLLLAVDRQLNALRHGNLDQRLRLGSRVVTRRDLKDTLDAFRRLLTRNLSPADFNRAVRERFEIIEAGKGRAGRKRMRFTGYYTPIIDAGRHRSARYRYPLYRKPERFPTRVVSWGSSANNRDYGFHVSAEPQKLLLTRKQIDGDYALQNRNLEIAWLEDDLDRYFLHIQGSGYLRFADGTVQSVRFDGSNRLPYKSVGRQMIADGVISENQGSMQGIKAYFRRHPEDIQRYLFQNRRYIFFELTDRGPTGSVGVELVPGRSIATDKSIYPGGGLAFITAKKPVLDADNRIVGWQTFSRFVLDQDTGSAIRGPGRADLYFGVGDSAGAAAGHYYQRGRIVYLLKKK